MFHFNKLVWLLISPVSIGVILIGMALTIKLWTRWVMGNNNIVNRLMKFAWSLVGFGLAWLIVMSMPIVGRIVTNIAGLTEYGVVDDNSLPKAEAIVVLSGDYLDRIPTGVRLWRAGKAPIIIPSGTCAEEIDAVLMRDLGVAKEAIVVENKARNTEENARYEREIVLRRLAAGNGNAGGKPKVLLVTSWYHMKRSMMIHNKVAPEIEWVPVVTKYGTEWLMKKFGWWCFNPSVAALHDNMAICKELVGIAGYKLRGF